MTDKQIIIEDYFNIMRDDYGRIYCIQDIGDSKELIKAIREQNEYIKRKEQECEELKNELIDVKWKIEAQDIELNNNEEQLDQLKAENERLDNEAQNLFTEKTNLEIEIKELKAENEELKNFHINLVGVKECEIKELAELKADNKHLNDLLNQSLKELEELQNLKDEDSLRVVILARENEQLKNRINDFVCSENCYKYKEAQRYKQVIEKVREIAKEHVPRCDIPSYECNYECDCEMCHYRDLNQIIQICDEVNDETTNN